MPIGIVSDDELQAELDSLNRTTRPQAVVLEKPHKGRDKGDVNVPDSLRQIIGEEAVINGRQAALQIAADFGISPASVSAYAKGATSTASYDTPSRSIISHINKSRERAIKRASKTLNAALGAISQDKLDYTDAKDLSGIARDMSVIIKNLEPPQVDATVQAGAPQFVIFAPQFRKEETFETIVVNE